MTDVDFIRKSILEAPDGLPLHRLAKLAEAKRGITNQRVRVILATMKRKGELLKRGRYWLASDKLFAIAQDTMHDEAHKPRVAVLANGRIKFYGRALTASSALTLADRLQEAAVEALTCTSKDLIASMESHEQALTYVAETWPFTPAGKFAEAVMKKLG